MIVSFGEGRCVKPPNSSFQPFPILFSILFSSITHILSILTALPDD